MVAGEQTVLRQQTSDRRIKDVDHRSGVLSIVRKDLGIGFADTWNWTRKGGGSRGT